MVNRIIKKEKEFILGILMTIQLIEVDIQLIIRLFLNLYNIDKVESNSRFSKYNFGLREKYSMI